MELSFVLGHPNVFICFPRFLMSYNIFPRRKTNLWTLFFLLSNA